MGDNIEISWAFRNLIYTIHRETGVPVDKTIEKIVLHPKVFKQIEGNWKREQMLDGLDLSRVRGLMTMYGIKVEIADENDPRENERTN